MRNKLAITVFMIGLAGGASAQQYYQAGGTDTPLKTDAQLNDNSNNSSSKGNNNERQKQHCKDSDRVSEKRSNSVPDHPHADRKDSGKSQSPDQAVQNTIEYGG
jgi:hypothetical protein